MEQEADNQHEMLKNQLFERFLSALSAHPEGEPTYEELLRQPLYDGGINTSQKQVSCHQQ